MGSRKILFEGDKLSVYHTNGKSDVNPLRSVQSEFMIPRKDLPTTTAADMIEKLSTAADDMAGQIERGFFETLHKTVDEHDQWIPGNPTLTPEGILKGLEKIWIDFEDDDRSKPIKPTIVAAPGAFEQLKASEATATEEDKRQYQERERVIMDTKYEEYMADLRSRELID